MARATYVTQKGRGGGAKSSEDYIEQERKNTEVEDFFHKREE